MFLLISSQRQAGQFLTSKFCRQQQALAVTSTCCADLRAKFGPKILMKNMFAIPCILVTALIGAGCASNSMDKVASTLEVEHSRERTIKSFEFLGCAGEWTDEVKTPEVWRTENARSTQYIARHIGSCGYNIGLRPKASVIDGILDLSYEPTNTSSPIIGGKKY